MVAMPPIAVLTYVFAHRVHPISRIVQAKKGNLTEATDEAVIGIEMVQAFGREDDVRSRFGDRAEAVRDGEAGGLQERQRAAAGADEDEASAGGVRFARGGVARGEFPAGIEAAETRDAVAGHDAAIFLRAERREELAGELAEIYVGAGVDFSGGNGLVAAAVDEERRPAANDVALIAEGHRAEKRMRRQSGVPCAEEGDLRGAAHET